MVDLPDQYMVHLKDDSFKKMKNLKILIVRNGHFYGSPQHLPNNLRLLDWMEYPSSTLPSTFHPKKLVVLNLSRSRFTMQEPFKVRFQCYHLYIDLFLSLPESFLEIKTKINDGKSKVSHQIWLLYHLVTMLETNFTYSFRRYLKYF